MWPHEWKEDPRTPIFSFTFQENAYGVFSLHPGVWLELLGALVLQALAASILGVIIFHTVLKRARSISSVMLGFGCFIPCFLVLPILVLPIDSSFHNKLLRFGLGGIMPVVLVFRTSAAVFGFTPKYASKSAKSFALYFSSPMMVRYDEKLDKYAPTSWIHLLNRLRKFLLYVAITGIFLSLFELEIPNIPKFGVVYDDHYFSIDEVLKPSRWIANLLHAILFQLYLSVFGEGMILMTELITGKEVLELMKNPIFESQSPTDFWGRRWNHVVHHCLKNGVYKPTRYITNSALCGTLGAFVVSGILHEWLLYFVFQDEDVNYGPTTAFFAWQAGLVFIEITCGHFFEPLKVLPRSIQSAAIVLCGLPLAHWFLQYYVQTEFFQVAGAAFPMIKSIAK